METSENRDFPPKQLDPAETPTDSVTEKSGFPPKTQNSIEKPMIEAVAVERSGFPPKKLARQLVFTEFGLSPAASPSPEHSLSPANRYVPPRSPFSLINSGSPISHPQANNRSNNGTPKGHKQCHCKQSKCLKLYCECFACGAHCDGCSCIDCHNNVENEAVRQLAVEITLERKPNAFKPKIVSSPCSTRDNRDDVKDVLMMGKHNKGCNCKKTGCLKRYCECFQANIFCSENCKCVDCKNKGCEDMMAVSGGDNKTTEICIQQAISDAVGSSGYRISSASRKRELQELIDSDDKNTTIQGLTQHQQVNPLRVSPLSVVSADPVGHIASSAVLCSSKSPYRSLLADVIHPEVTRELCSVLVRVSEAAKTPPDKNGTADRQEVRENQTLIALTAQDLENCQEGRDFQKAAYSNHLSRNGAGTKDPKVCRSRGNDEQEERPLPPGTVELMCDEKNTLFKRAASLDQIFNHSYSSDVDIEQERLVLACFRDCLKKIITTANIRARTVMEGQFERISSRIVKARTEISATTEMSVEREAVAMKF